MESEQLRIETMCSYRLKKKYYRNKMVLEGQSPCQIPIFSPIPPLQREIIYITMTFNFTSTSQRLWLEIGIIPILASAILLYSIKIIWTDYFRAGSMPKRLKGPHMFIELTFLDRLKKYLTIVFEAARIILTNNLIKILSNI